MLNSSPKILDQFKNFPDQDRGQCAGVYWRRGNGIGQFCRADQHRTGERTRATYLAILKHADASTLAVVDAARDALPQIREVAPQGMELKIDFDQSVFVRGAIEGVCAKRSCPRSSFRL